MKSRVKMLWQAWSERFAALNQRERGLLAGALVLGTLYLGAIMWVEPMFSRAKSYARQSASQSAELSGLRAQIVALGQRVAADPNQPLRAELENIHQQLREADERMGKFDASLVPPEKTALLLEGIVRKTPGVRLTGFKTLPVEGVLAARQKKDSPTATGEVAPVLEADIYKHGFELKVRGNYLALLSYLKMLESQPERLLWQRAQLSVSKYPESELTLTVFTLSTDRHWLEL